MKPLKKMTVNEETFNYILQMFPYKQFESLREYQYGYKDRDIVYTDGRDLIIVRRQLSVLGLVEVDPYKDNWYQIYVHKEIEQKENIIENDAGVSVGEAIKKINRIIHTYYSDEEKEQIYRNHEKESSTILHESINTEPDTILRFSDCYYYDANGAYASELIKLFPKCKEEFTEMYIHRHDNNNKYKNCFNYYVGCLTMNPEKEQFYKSKGWTIRKTYPKTRHYIVTNITNKMIKLKNKLRYESCLYLNTDGMIIQHPHNVVEHSDEMGEFKIEYQGDVYTYRDKNYSIIQYGDEIKGNLPLELRKYVDLRVGKVVHYDKILSEDGMRYMCKNVEIEIKGEVKNYD